MINTSNLKQALKALGFSSRGDVWASKYRQEADFAARSLVYPEDVIVHEKQTCNFDANENCYPIDTAFYLNLIKKDVDLKYLYHALQQIDTSPKNKGTGVPGLNRNEFYEKSIVLPPLPIQQKIVAEVEALEKRIGEAQEVMAGCAGRKNKVIHDLMVMEEGDD
jgi:hypothetical protein